MPARALASIDPILDEGQQREAPTAHRLESGKPSAIVRSSIRHEAHICTCRAATATVNQATPGLPCPLVGRAAKGRAGALLSNVATFVIILVSGKSAAPFTIAFPDAKSQTACAEGACQFPSTQRLHRGDESPTCEKLGEGVDGLYQ